MAITRLQAEAAINALKNSVEAVIKNAQYHDQSHWSEAKARSALSPTKPTCGFYYKSRTEKVYEHKSDPKLNKPFDPDQKLSPKVAKNFTLVTSQFKDAIGLNDCWILLQHALVQAIAGNATLKEGTTATRFMAITGFPQGYGGLAVHRANPATTACAQMTVVIEGSSASSAAIVTHFPADAPYFANFAALV